MTTTFNTEMNKQIRELTVDELEAVADGFPIAVPIIVALAGIGFLAGAGAFDSVGSAIDWRSIR